MVRAALARSSFGVPDAVLPQLGGRYDRCQNAASYIG
jgi:hypothetical protein